LVVDGGEAGRLIRLWPYPGADGAVDICLASVRLVEAAMSVGHSRLE
jgi:hypothetical protein